MMQTQATIGGNDYTIHFELDNQNEISVDSVIDERFGNDVWGGESFTDYYGDQILAECRQFLNENL